MRATERRDNSVTYEFSSESKAQEVADRYNKKEDFYNGALVKGYFVVFMGQRFKKEALAEFSAGELDAFGRKADE